MQSKVYKKPERSLAKHKNQTAAKSRSDGIESEYPARKLQRGGYASWTF